VVWVDRQTSSLPQSIVIVAHSESDVCDGAHWAFVTKKGWGLIHLRGGSPLIAKCAMSGAPGHFTLRQRALFVAAYSTT